MLVSQRAPLAIILELAVELTRDAPIIELIDLPDSMIRRLTRGRNELHKDLERQYAGAGLAETRILAVLLNLRKCTRNSRTFGISAKKFPFCSQSVFLWSCLVRSHDWNRNCQKEIDTMPPPAIWPD